MTIGSLLLQCLLTAVTLHSQLILTAAQQDYRLTGGSTQYEGTVEVFRNGEWQTVCNDGWGMTEGNLVCRLLGYGPAITTHTDAATRFGEGAGNIWVKDWECTGRENSLEECPSGVIFFCFDSEAAGVTCMAPISGTTPPPSNTSTRTPDTRIPTAGITPTIPATSSPSNSTVSLSNIPTYIWYIVGGVAGLVILCCLCCCVWIICGVCCHLGKLDCNCCEDCLSSCTAACCAPCVACITSCGQCIKTCITACCAPCLACLQAFGACCSSCTAKMCTAIGEGLKTCCTACCLPFVLCGKCLKAMVSCIGSCTRTLYTGIGNCLKACCTACCMPFVLCGKAISSCFKVIGSAIQSCFKVLCAPVIACTECFQSYASN